MVKELSAIGIDWNYVSKIDRNKRKVEKLERSLQGCGSLTFLKCFQALVKFKKIEGHSNLPSDHELFKWFENIKELNQMNKLPESKRCFFQVSDIHLESFEENLQLLVIYLANNERSYDSLKNNAEHGNLGRWCDEMRQMKRRGQLDIDTIDTLDAMKFPWYTSLYRNCVHETRESDSEEDRSNTTPFILSEASASTSTPFITETSSLLCDERSSSSSLSDEESSSNPIDGEGDRRRLSSESDSDESLLVEEQSKESHTTTTNSQSVTHQSPIVKKVSFAKEEFEKEERDEEPCSGDLFFKLKKPELIQECSNRNLFEGLKAGKRNRLRKDQLVAMLIENEKKS